MKYLNNIFSILSFIYILSIGSITTFAQSYSGKVIKLKTTNYNLDFSIDYEQETLSAVCGMTLVNNSGENTDVIPLILYRLMKVKSITDNQGNNIPFTQQVVSFEDWGVMQVNFIEASLIEPLPSKQKIEIIIKYEGYLLGYTETGMSYVKDKINPDFTIIRADSRAYPRLGYPSWAVNRSAGFQNYDYEISITIPDTLTAANGGKLIRKTHNGNEVTYLYKNIKPAWRMDVAIAKYDVIENGNIKIYYFPEDSAGSYEVINAAGIAMNLYTDWWGELKYFEGFSIIEIPEGWGSQTDVTCIIQTASAFKDTKQHHELYHELTHLWNDVKKIDEFPCRWDEGMASFIEYLTVEKLENRKVLKNVTGRIFKSLQAEYNKNPEYLKIPMIDFGKEGITSLSYKVGMLLFQVLYNIVGEEEFNNLFASFYSKYTLQGATTLEFVNHLKMHCRVELHEFFNDWLFTTNYTEFVLNNVPIEDIASKYN